MEIKLIALDLDDTLLNNEHQLEARTIKAVKSLKKQGKIIVIATGRMYCAALAYAQELELTTPLITYNGAYVQNTSNQEIILHKPVAIEDAHDLLKEAKENKLHIQLYIDDRLFVEKQNDLTDRYAAISGVKAEAVGDLHDFIEQDPTKVLIIEPDHERRKYYIDKFQKKYAGRLEVTSSKNLFIEFTAKDISKASALQIVAEKYNVEREEVMALGDGWNDLTMLKWAGVGVAMGNADPEVRAQADEVAEDHNQAGVASFLERFFALHD